MGNWKNWLRARRPTRRRLIQLYAALLYNAHLRGFVEGEIYTGGAKFLCVPGLNCYSCPAAAGACPLGSLQNALASSRGRAPFYALGMLMLFGLAFGRVVCGFLCPFGLIQELLHKLPVPKLRKGRVTRALSYVKYALLGVLAIGIPLVYAAQRFPLPAFCKYVCPAGTLEGAVALLAHPENAGLFSMLGGLFAGKFAILIAILAAWRVRLSRVLPLPLPAGRDLRLFLSRRAAGREGRSRLVHELRAVRAQVPDGRPPRGRSRVHPLRRVRRRVSGEGDSLARARAPRALRGVG